VAAILLRSRRRLRRSSSSGVNYKNGTNEPPTCAFGSLSITLTFLKLTDGLGSESSSHDDVSSVLSGKLRTLMGEVSCLGEVSVDVGDGTVSHDDDGMLLQFEFNLVGRGDGEERVVGRIFSGGGLQS
jgi:hypothetical protein